MQKRTLLIILLILTLALTSCGRGSELERNRAKWSASGVTHYQFDLTVSCFCPFQEILPVHVEVKDGVIVSMLGANGQPLPENFLGTFEEAGTVEGLFAIARDNLSNAEQVEITYHEQYGYPVSIIVDRIKLAMDDEIAYYVAGFEVLQ